MWNTVLHFYCVLIFCVGVDSVDFCNYTNYKPPATKRKVITIWYHLFLNYLDYRSLTLALAKTWIYPRSKSNSDRITAAMYSVQATPRHICTEILQQYYRHWMMACTRTTIDLDHNYNHIFSWNAWQILSRTFEWAFNSRISLGALFIGNCR